VTAGRYFTSQCFRATLISVSDLSWLDPEEFRVFRAFTRSTRRLGALFDEELQSDVGMPRTYFEILWLLHQAPNQALRMSDLAESTFSKASRISHAVARLEEAGQVRRELCTSDRRGWFTVLTDQGLAALKVAAPRYARSIREHLLEPLSHTQRNALAQIGETVIRQLDISSGPASVSEETDLVASAPARSPKIRRGR